MPDLKDNPINLGFSKISNQYETLDRTSSLIGWMRSRVRTHFEKHLSANSTILEINCGSGIDAVYFAKKRYPVHATDIAQGMIDHVQSKISSQGLEKILSCDLVSFEELNKIDKQFFHIFSNFGGLNCSSLNTLEKVFQSFNDILKPNGSITMVIMPKLCIWEFLKIFKGNKNAFRRLKKNGVFANIEGERVQVYYHNANTIKALLKHNFSNFEIENICFLGPTGNQVDFPEKHPFIFKLFSKLDMLSNKISFLRGYGDYYIITAKKK